MTDVTKDLAVEQEVTQADRDAYNSLMQDEGYDYEPTGEWHFAQHRLASTEALRAENEALRNRERETLAVLQTAHESEAALIIERERMREALEAASDRLLRAARIMSDEFLTMTAEQFLGYSEEARAAITGEPA